MYPDFYLHPAVTRANREQQIQIQNPGIQIPGKSRIGMAGSLILSAVCLPAPVSRQ